MKPFTAIRLTLLSTPHMPSGQHLGRHVEGGVNAILFHVVTASTQCSRLFLSLD
jgi:hypothetical protein